MSGTYCKGMTRKEYHRAYYLANREKALVSAKAVYQSNPERSKAQAAKWARENPERNAAHRNKVSNSDAVTPKPAVCDACQQPPRGARGLHLDHNHATGEFRGWLCHHCNVALGNVRDSVEILIKLAAYLESR